MIFPFITSYDPLGTSEGALDPLGLYQIADQLAQSWPGKFRQGHK